MKRNLPRCGLAATVAGALALGLVGGPAASAGSDSGAAKATATINIKSDGMVVFFEGPAEVVAGQPLKIVNRTMPSTFGGHTFSLVEKKVIPRTANEHFECFVPGHICRDVAVAHKFDMKTQKITRAVARARKRGWDKMFTKRAKGDSWYTEKHRGSFSQKVTAKPGTTLYFMCAVHTGMRSQIKVVK